MKTLDKDTSATSDTGTKRPVMNKPSKALLLVPGIALLGLVASLGDTPNGVTPNAISEPVHVAQAAGTGTLERSAALGVDRGGQPTVAELSLTEDFSAPDAALSYQAPIDFVGPPLASAATDSGQAEEAEDTAPRSPRDKMSGPVAALAAAGGPGLVDIVVRYDEHPAMFDDEYVASLGGTVVRRYQTLEMRAIRIPAESLEALAVDDNVDWMSVDDEVAFTAMYSHDAANVPSTNSGNFAYSGSNVGIAILDSGISAHADIDANVLQYSFLGGAYPIPDIVNGEVSGANASVREDLFGHGTHVAGIVTGTGTDSEGTYSGVASGATLLSLQVLDGSGSGSMSDVMAALDWLRVYGDYFGVRVVNLSLGKGISESNTTDPLVAAVEDLWDDGFVVVVAAGNSGNFGAQTITSPGNSRKVITVGSLTDSGTGTDLSDDYVSSFSSMGPTIGDLVLKPDLVAPGNSVVAAISPNSTLASILPNRVVGCSAQNCTSDYFNMSGTSMATPMVSAAVALMLEKDPTLTPATIKARLMRSARKFDANPSAAGAGALDIDAALNETGIVVGEALSPLMIKDEASDGVLVEDTSLLWGDDAWGAGYLFNDGFTWATGYGWTNSSGVHSNGYAWTDGEVWAEGYGWTDGGGVHAKGYGWTDGGGVHAEGYGWTDGVHARSFMESDGNGGMVVNDDPVDPVSGD